MIRWYFPMRLRTRGTLVARKPDEPVQIFVPVNEFVETESSDLTCKLSIIWRGQRLIVEPADLRRALAQDQKPLRSAAG